MSPQPVAPTEYQNYSTAVPDFKHLQSKSSTNNSAEATLPKLPKVTCHGPVADLGSMVPALWWKGVFSDELYLKTDGDVVEDEDITREEISLLSNITEVSKLLGVDSGVVKASNTTAALNITETNASGFNHTINTNGSHVINLESNTHGSINTNGNNCKCLLIIASTILDLCCGQGRHSLHLIKKYPNLKVHGHDQSSYLISLAKERALAQCPDPSSRPVFTVGDCRSIPYPNNTFNLVILMGNSFGYFSEDEQDRAVLAEIQRILKLGGVLVLDLTDGEYMRHNFAERSWEWADETTFVCRERQLSPDSLRLNSREIITVTTKGVVRDQFYQERLYSRLEICSLLRREGFTPRAETLNESNVTLGEMSKRGEDLGMMANRMFVTVVKALPELAPESKAEATIERITVAPPPVDLIIVLLGDPSKPCIGKLNNTWNEEDITTRSKLIEALESSGSILKVIESHDLIHQSLTDNKNSFVFNLCDEGWHNDALKELHVPALLEMLGVQYTGAGPNCLAFCYDKGLVNRSSEAIGIPTANELTFIPNTSAPHKNQFKELGALVSKKIGFPAFIKPIKGDNSLGITSRSIVNSTSDLESYMIELETHGIRQVLVQEYLQGTEYGIGVIGNPESGFTFLPILEVDFSEILEQKLAPILGYESKWDPSSPYWTSIKYKTAQLSPLTEKTLKKHCVALWHRFNCRDYARFDFRCDIGRGDGVDPLNGTIKLLEVNPNPGWCWDGKFAYMAKMGGYGYSDMLNLILNAAWNRIKKKE